MIMEGCPEEMLSRLVWEGWIVRWRHVVLFHLTVPKTKTPVGAGKDIGLLLPNFLPPGHGTEKGPFPGLMQNHRTMACWRQKAHLEFMDTEAQRGERFFHQGLLIFHPGNQVASHVRADSASDTIVMQDAFFRKK